MDRLLTFIDGRRLLVFAFDAIERVPLDIHRFTTLLTVQIATAVFVVPHGFSTEQPAELFGVA